ncbi:MAG: DMT family transporter [Candidatus Saccharicenans sp.]
MNQREKGLLLAHLAVLLFGFPGVIGRALPFTPIQLTWARVVLASLTLAAILRISDQTRTAVRSADLWLLFSAGFLLAFHWTAFFLAVKKAGVAVGLFSYSTFPVFTAFLEPLLLKTRFRASYVWLALMTVAGIFLMVPEFRLTNRIFLGLLWGIFSGLSFSLLSVLNKKLSLNYQSVFLALVQDALAALLLLPFLFSQPAAGLRLSLKNLALLFILGVVCTAGAHTLFIKAISLTEARISSLISALEPVYGILFGYLFLREKPDLKTLAGGSLILLAVVMVSLAKNQELSEKET